MDGYKDFKINEQKGGLMDRWMDGWTDGLINERAEGRQMDGWRG